MKGFTKKSLGFERFIFTSFFLISCLLVYVSRTYDFVQYFSFASAGIMFYYLIVLINKKDKFSLLFIILASVFVRSYPLLRTPYLYTNNVWSNAYIVREMLETGFVPLQVTQHPENAHVSWPFHFFVEAIVCSVTGLSSFLVEKWIGNLFVGPVSLLFIYLIGRKFSSKENTLKAVLFFGLLASFYNNINSHTTNIPEFLLIAMFYFALRKDRWSKVLVVIMGIGLMNIHPLTFLFSFIFLGPVMYFDLKEKNYNFLIYLILLILAMDLFWFHGPYPFMYKNMKYLLESFGLDYSPLFSEVLFMSVVFSIFLPIFLFTEIISRIRLSFKMGQKKNFLFIGLLIVFVVAFLMDVRINVQYSFREAPVKYFLPLLFAVYLFFNSFEKGVDNRIPIAVLLIFVLFFVFSLVPPFSARLDAMRVVSYALIPLSFIVCKRINLDNKMFYIAILLLCFFSTHPNHVFCLDFNPSEAYSFVNSFDVFASKWLMNNSGERRLVMTDTTLSGIVLYYGNRSAPWDKAFPALTANNKAYFMDKLMTHINSPAIIVNNTFGDGYHFQGSKYFVVNNRLFNFGVVHGYGLPTKPVGFETKGSFLDRIYVNNEAEIYLNNKV